MSFVLSHTTSITRQWRRPRTWFVRERTRTVTSNPIAVTAPTDTVAARIATELSALCGCPMAVVPDPRVVGAYVITAQGG